MFDGMSESLRGEIAQIDRASAGFGMHVELAAGEGIGARILRKSR
jgi:hypothetical protein